MITAKVRAATVTCICAGREVTHCPVAIVLEGVLVVCTPSSLFFFEVTNQVPGGVRLVESGLPNLALPVPADTQVVREAHP